MDSFLELARQRRSIRKYTDQKVEREKVEQILQAALMSPASKRCNPWEFVVVEDHEVLAKMSGCRTYGSQLLEQSPLGIVVCLDTTLTDTWQCDGAIAAENMLLAAEDLGLGACWVQVYGRQTKEDSDEKAEDMIKSLCEIPDGLTVLCVVSIGYKNEDRQPREIAKLQYEKIHYGKY